MDSREIQPGIGNGRGGDSGHIKAEIDHTRERIDGTLEAIAEKLHPKHLLDEAIDYIRSPGQITGTAGKLGQTVWHQIQQHPMPALLIGAGLAWMLSEEKKTGTAASRRLENRIEPEPSSSSLSQSAGEMAHAASEKTSAFGQAVKEKTGEFTESVREKSSDIAQAIKEKSQTIKDKSVEQAMRLKEATTQMSTQTRERAGAVIHRAEDMISEATNNYPLAMGLGFLAVGMLAGLALPHTQLEDKTLGETADQLKEKVRDQSRQVMETAQRGATAVAHAVTEEAQKQGLTPQNITEKIQHVASEAAKAAADSAHREGLDQETLTQRVQTVAGEAKRVAQEEMNRPKAA